MSDQNQDTKDTSVDDDVRAAFASLKEPASTPVIEAVQPDLLASEPKEGETAEQAAQRARDEQGRFAKESKESNRVKAEKPAGDTPVVEQPVAAQPTQAVKAPDGWSAQMKAEFGKLPANVQAEINRREMEMHRKFTSQDEDRTFGKKIREIASPYQATLAAEGASHEAAFQQYLNTAYILRTGSPQMKAQALQAIAQQFNVDLGMPLQQGANQQHQPVIRPDEVAQLVQAEISKQRQVQEQTELQREIDAFAADPANVHYEALKPVMAGLLSSGAVASLRDAYDQALWANPDIRSTLTAAQQSEQESKRLTEAQRKADAAKRASGSIAGGPGGTVPVNGAQVERSLEDELRANFRAATAARI